MCTCGPMYDYIRPCRREKRTSQFLPPPHPHHEHFADLWLFGLEIECVGWRKCVYDKLEISSIFLQISLPPLRSSSIYYLYACKAGIIRYKNCHFCIRCTWRDGLSSIWIIYCVRACPVNTSGASQYIETI